MAPRTQAQLKFFKRYLKTLQVAEPYPKELKQLLQQAPIPVLKLLINAAIIASKGDIQLSPTEKKLFKAKRKFFSVLGSRIPIEAKRQYLVQSGKGFLSLIPILLSTVLPLAGDLLFKLFHKE